MGGKREIRFTEGRCSVKLLVARAKYGASADEAEKLKWGSWPKFALNCEKLLNRDFLLLDQ